MTGRPRGIAGAAGAGSVRGRSRRRGGAPGTARGRARRPGPAGRVVGRGIATFGIAELGRPGGHHGPNFVSMHTTSAELVLDG